MKNTSTKLYYSAVLIAASIFIFSGELLGQPKNYGNSPDEYVPFGRYQKAYKQHFMDTMPYRGPNREKPIPKDVKEVRIGFLGPLEGSPITYYGISMYNGVMMAVEEENARGGYKGLPFVVMPHNDVGLWGAAANEIVKMDDEKCWAILGTIDDINTHVGIRIALKLEIPVINIGDPDPTLTETNIPWVMRNISDDRQSSYALANYIYKVKNIDNVAVLRVNNRYGRVGPGEFKDAMERMGHPVLLELRFMDGDTDFTTQLEHIKNSSAKAILLWGNYYETALIVNQIKQMGIQLPIIGCDRMVHPEFLKIAGKNAEGIVNTHPWNPTLDDPVVQTFISNYKKRFNMEPDQFAAHGYDGAKITMDAIRRGGLNRARIRDYLLDLKTYQGYKGVTGELYLDASWNDIGKIWMTEVKNGKFVFSPTFSEPNQ